MEVGVDVVQFVVVGVVLVWEEVWASILFWEAVTVFSEADRRCKAEVSCNW